MFDETQSPVENVINPKSLERQIKILDQRLSELRSEMNVLERRREACQILLGVPLPAAGTSVDVAAMASQPVPKKPVRGKKKEVLDEDENAELPEERDIIRPSELLAEIQAQA